MKNVSSSIAMFADSDAKFNRNDPATIASPASASQLDRVRRAHRIERRVDEHEPTRQHDRLHVDPQRLRGRDGPQPPNDHIVTADPGTS